MKVIIPAAGLGARFLPLSQAIPKELLPLGDLPIIHYIVKEAMESGIEQIVFVLSENKKAVIDYFKKQSKLEALLESRGEKELLKKFNQNHKIFEKLSFSSAIQPKPIGNGDAVLKARQQIGKGAFVVMSPNIVLKTKKSAIEQLLKVFKTSEKPVIGLKKFNEEDKLSFYGVAKVEKIAHRLYKIKEIIEEPKQGEAPSDLVIPGRYVLPNEVFNYLAKTKPNKKGEITLAGMFNLMLADGKMVYGYEMDGDFLECDRTIDWLKSNLYLTTQHSEYGAMIKDYLKKIL